MASRFRHNLLLGLSIFVLMVLVLAPFYWIFSSSIKLPQEIISATPTFVPHSFTTEHYDKLLGESSFPTYMRNSIVVAVGTMAITVVLSTLAAYGLYRLRFPGRITLFRVILITYAFPGVLLLVPMYQMMSKLKLVDSLTALVIVNVTLSAPFAVWMLQAFFRTIPRELEEAAALDGASRLGIIVRIMLPLAAPGVASIAIFAFITSWTEYIFSSILIISEANRTLPVGLAGIIGQYQIDWGLLLAGATATTLPVLILFSLVGRNFVEGLTAGAVK
ncbi:carbohydrate ABC transporter permease [Aggregatilinea lenta]|uniref:carbohydrate ABC transporter permease n=1 Tax=Aggregatilinea lenta TaxID=913108 RepID=UPI000E5C507D|nr:carbohydrate ABC transporter permease [Aggregatilinea lenta]